MDPVYAVVKARSTTYCVLFWRTAQDMDNQAESRGLFLNDLFCKVCKRERIAHRPERSTWQFAAHARRTNEPGSALPFSGLLPIAVQRLLAVA